MVHLRGEHSMKYSENDYNERHAECPAGMSITQQETTGPGSPLANHLRLISQLGGDVTAMGRLMLYRRDSARSPAFFTMLGRSIGRIRAFLDGVDRLQTL